MFFRLLQVISPVASSEACVKLFCYAQEAWNVCHNATPLTSWCQNKRGILSACAIALLIQAILAFPSGLGFLLKSHKVGYCSAGECVCTDDIMEINQTSSSCALLPLSMCRGLNDWSRHVAQNQPKWRRIIRLETDFYTFLLFMRIWHCLVMATVHHFRFHNLNVKNNSVKIACFPFCPL